MKLHGLEYKDADSFRDEMGITSIALSKERRILSVLCNSKLNAFLLSFSVGQRYPTRSAHVHDASKIDMFFATIDRMLAKFWRKVE